MLKAKSRLLTEITGSIVIKQVTIFLHVSKNTEMMKTNVKYTLDQNHSNMLLYRPFVLVLVTTKTEMTIE